MHGSIYIHNFKFHLIFPFIIRGVFNVRCVTDIATLTRSEKSPLMIQTLNFSHHPDRQLTKSVCKMKISCIVVLYSVYTSTIPTALITVTPA
jgi:hypothetical protein